MASLLNLPLEITHQILSELTGSDPEPYDILRSYKAEVLDTERANLGLSSMAKLCQTCHQLRVSVEPRLYHFVYIHQASVMCLLSLLKNWISRPHCVEYTRRLVIKAEQRPKQRALETIADQDIIFISNLVARLGLHLRNDWHEFPWRVDILIELVMFVARNARCMNISFTPKEGIYRGSFDWLLEDDYNTTGIRFDHLQHLRLFQKGRLSMDEIQPVIDRAPNLESLYLDTVRFTNHQNRLPASLTNLYLSGCSITPSMLESLTTDVNKLRHLKYDTPGPRQLGPLIKAIAKHKRTLKSLLVYFHLDSEFGIDIPLYAFGKLESLTTDLQSFGFESGSQLMESFPTSLRELRLVPFGGLSKRRLKLFAAELKAREEQLCKDLFVYIDGQEERFDHRSVLQMFTE
ncbi:f-box domain protein [Colletotrichum incanum]|uniref:F-box domain protein n=1 Tax=Colletotrichum incanum TaxID=1573173 RepID=A0A167E8Q8_COLIC|nr:f-box domain protein [Colletotrichum incanum]